MNTFGKAGMEAKATALADAKRISQFIHSQRKEDEERRSRERAYQQAEKANDLNARRARETGQVQEEQSRSQPINFQNEADELINSAREAASYSF